MLSLEQRIDALEGMFDTLVGAGCEKTARIDELERRIYGLEGKSHEPVDVRSLVRQELGGVVAVQVAENAARDAYNQAVRDAIALVRNGEARAHASVEYGDAVFDNDGFVKELEKLLKP